MPLSPSTLHDIKLELSALRDLRTKIDERIKALDAILVPFDVGPKVIDTAMGEMVEIPKPSGASAGLRAAILATLKAQGAMRSPDIAVLLENQGFQNDSKTPLATRVYNDLWRMSQKGIVKSQMGEFSLPK